MKKILIIEDDRVVASIYRNKFLGAGYKVEVAVDGEEGLAVVKNFRPDLVQLDLMMPKINGVEVLKKLRADPEWKSLPVVVLSNSYLMHMVEEAWRAGATRCIAKSDCSPRQMVEIVGTLLAEEAPAPPPPTSPAPTGGTAFFRAPTVPAVASSGEADAAFQMELRKSFLESGPQTIGVLRTLLQNVLKGEGDTARLASISELFRKVRSVASNAAVVEYAPIARLSSGLEALLKELYDKPQNISASSLRTVAQTVDLLEALYKTGQNYQAAVSSTPGVLVVDDDLIARRAIVYALEKVGIKCITLEDPVAALNMMAENRFDLIFLDVDMPGMDGFELCRKIRAQPSHEKTPVVFVTALTDFESRAKSALSGGNDLIAKPFLFMELAVKALLYLLRPR